jgi:hypothetical protein
MYCIKLIAACLLAFGSVATSERLPDDHILWGREGRPTSLVKRATATSAVIQPTLAPDTACTVNGPLTRNCWPGEYNIQTDFDLRWPNTGVVRSYNLEITNGTCAPDGQSRPCLLINGQYPGPRIWSNWGDIIRVTVKNSLQTNGTGLHWHGVRQLNTNSQDGVPGITECPLAPGDTKVYEWQSTQV